MSVARQPDPRGARDAARCLRWALAATMSALVLVLVLLAVALLSLRRQRQALPPARSPHLPARSATVPPGTTRLSHPAAGAAQRVTRRTPVHRSHPPLVRIVERPVAPPVPPVGAVEQPHPVPPSIPRPRRLEHQQRLRPQPRSLPAPIVKPALAAAPLAPHTDAEAAPEMPPVPVAQPPADYPTDAAADGASGMVRLKVIVNSRGRVEDAIVVRSSGDDRLDEAAERAVRRWRYRPARRGGQPVPGVDYALLSFHRSTPRLPGD